MTSTRAPWLFLLVFAGCTDGIDTCNTDADCTDGFACDTGRCVEAPSCPALFRDGDGDSFGDPGSAERQCSNVSGFVVNDDDCDDTDATVRPNATELPADNVDQDCDGVELCPLDADDDGVPGAATEPGPLGCAAAPALLDCDDDDDARAPGREDAPGDDEDTDCDGVVTCFRDADGDGAGGPLVLVSEDADCADPTEARMAIDCDDENPARFPGADEIPGTGVDEDCDDAEACYRDADEDAFVGREASEEGDADCADPGEDLEPGPDCDDDDATVRPGAFELPLDGVDQDCDGVELCPLDADRNGLGHLTELNTGPLDCVGDAVANNRSDCAESGALDGAVCEDGLSCTKDDRCTQGVCAGIPDGCICEDTCDACSIGACCNDDCPGGVCEACVGCACDLTCSGSSACDASCAGDALCHVDFSSSAPAAASCNASRCLFEGGSSTTLSVDCAQSECELALNSSGPKEVTCGVGTSCVGTVESTNSIVTTCSDGATCNLALSTSGLANSTCDRDAACVMDVETNSGFTLRCEDASCDTTCGGTGSCSVQCVGTAACLLDCTYDFAPCTMLCATELVECPSGELACNTPCPPAN